MMVNHYSRNWFAAAATLLALALVNTHMMAKGVERDWLEIRESKDIDEIDVTTRNILVSNAALANDVIEAAPRTKIEALSIIDAQLTFDEWGIVGQMESLSYINIRNSNAADKNINQVSGASSLHYLNVSDCGKIKFARGLFEEFESLRRLDVSYTALFVGGQTVLGFGVPVSLTEFRANRCEGLSGGSLKGIGKLSALETIGLAGNDALRRLPAELCTLPKLLTLKLWNCKGLTGEAIKSLATSVTLRILSISHASKVQDDDFGQLANLSTLEELHLFSCDNLAQKGVEAVCEKELSQLDYIDISGNQSVSNSAVLELGTAFPNVDIFPVPGIHPVD